MSVRLLVLLGEFAFEALGHFWWGRAGQTEGHLDRVVDEPLQGGQRTDHDDTGTKTLPHGWKKKEQSKVSFHEIFTN